MNCEELSMEHIGVMSRTRYSISAAHRLTGKARSTIAKHLNSGKLSFTMDDDGNRMIEASELVRVYGALSEAEKGSQDKSTPGNSDGNIALHGEVRRLQERLTREEEERDRERRDLREQIEHLRVALQKAQDGHNRATLLLENQSPDNGEWKRELATIERRLASHETRAEERAKQATDQARKLKRELEQERSKSVWQKLLGN